MAETQKAKKSWEKQVRRHVSQVGAEIAFQWLSFHVIRVRTFDLVVVLKVLKVLISPAR